MNVHIFDGKIRNNHIIKNKFNNEQKIKMFDELYEVLQSDPAKKGLNLIKNIGCKDNYDNTNDMYADDIMAEICDYIIKESYVQDDSKREEKIKDIKSIIMSIDEQLSDMYNTGTCAQGRVIRLYQIYKSIYKITD